MDIIDKRLKPCPLCGSKEVAIKLPKNDEEYCVQTFYVKCYSCGLTGYKSYFTSKKENDVFDGLIKYWNTRHKVTV